MERLAGSDAAVVARARAGDDVAFQALVERHGRAVFRLAFRMTGDEHDAEDVVQEAFLKAHRQRLGGASRPSVRPAVPPRAARRSRSDSPRGGAARGASSTGAPPAAPPP